MPDQLSRKSVFYGWALEPIPKLRFWAEIKAKMGFKPRASSSIPKGLKLDANTESGPKDYFEIGSRINSRLDFDCNAYSLTEKRIENMAIIVINWQ
jgi:hypothetical protein